MKRALRAAGLVLAGFAVVGCRSASSQIVRGQCPNGQCTADAQCGKCGKGCRKGDCDLEALHPDHCWPEQYSRESIRRVNDPMAQQIEAGTAVETTLWQHYFSAEKGKEDELNPAGMRRLEYLARKRPYVITELSLETSFDKNLDAKRIAKATEYVQNFSTEGQVWTITPVNRKPSGLYGPEGPKSITKMVGVGNAPPRYETQIKAGFMGGGGGGRGGSGGSGGGAGGS